MITHNVVQGTAEWLAVRAGIPTASELGNLITPTGKIRTGEMPNTYLCRKLAERWTGAPLESFSGGVMEQGSILEDEAVPWYELAYECELERPGFITTDDGSFGCSPDAMEPGCGGVEIKCPQPGNHVKWLRLDDCPEEHYLQCQAGMFVTGCSVWRFVSYHRAFPKLVVDVMRNEEIMETIAKVAGDFKSAMESEYAKLIELNGGKEPKRRTPRAEPVVPDQF